MTPRTSTYLRRLALAAAGVAIAAGAMMLTAPAGNAIPESTIRSDCDKANKGTYTTTLGSDGKRYSKCCYLDINGVKHCDNYVDGSYTNTTVNNILEPSQPSPPPPPPGGEVVGPPAAAATPAPQPVMPEVEATLWLPPPAGPAAPPAGEAAPAR
jgi:hypothetical protein